MPPTPDDYVAKGLALRDALREQQSLSFCVAPHAPYSVSDKTFSRLITLAEELDLPVHMHVHETEAKSSAASPSAEYGRWNGCAALDW